MTWIDKKCGEIPHSSVLHSVVCVFALLHLTREVEQALSFFSFSS